MALLYSKHKIFHYKEKLDSLPETASEILPPISIRLKPTNVCNHNCGYCSYRINDLQLGKDMILKDYIPEQKMEEILEDIIDMKVKAVIFSGGGEPFVYPFFLQSIKRLVASDVKFASLTNGSRLKNEVAEIFAHHGTWIRVSIDGWDAASYAKYRGVKEDEFDKVIANMANFKKIGGKCNLGVSLIIDKDNYTHIYDFCKQLKNIGVDSVKVSPCIVDDDAAKNNRYHTEFFNKVKDQINRMKDDLVDETFEIFDAYHELEEKFDKDYTWCPFMQVTPVIGADLGVYACHDKAYTGNAGLLGSLKDQRFKDFWFSDKNKFFKINPFLHCNHHCCVNINNKHVLEYLNVNKDHVEFI